MQSQTEDTFMSSQLLEEMVESMFFPSDVSSKKQLFPRANMMKWDHSAKDNEKVHDHLAKLGFRPSGPSTVFGSETHTNYINKNTKMTASHEKGKAKSTLTIKKLGV